MKSGTGRILLVGREILRQIGTAREILADVPGQKVDAQERLLKTTTERIERLVTAIEDLNESFERAEKHTGSHLEHAVLYRDDVAPKMNLVRSCSDAVELLVDDSLWPLPKYREMLFLH